MKTFLDVVKKVRQRYPVLWENHGYKNRRIMVRYWLPALQGELFTRHGVFEA